MIWLLKGLAIAVVIAALLVIAARLIFPLPSLARRGPSSALGPSPETAIGAAVLRLASAHPGLSGVVPLWSGNDAFAARVLLADRAGASIDARYYIWQKDATGLLLLDALRRAAQRGVRVRLLLDDNGIAGLDPELAAFDALPNVQVRLFNPFTLRHPKFASYLFDFFRLNRRMHNKSFTVDGAVTVVGGRNVGDIYFARGAEAQYFDLDVLAAGKAAADVAADFDLYWSSQSSYPIGLLVAAPPDGLDRLAALVARAATQPDAQQYARSIRSSTFVQALVGETLPLDWVPMALVSDDPAKGLGQARRRGLMLVKLTAILGKPRRSLDLISAYFIPDKKFVRYLAQQAADGVRVRTLTNSMEATDVLPVQAGYSRFRMPLLAAGVEVFELKSGRDATDQSDRFGVLGSSTTSLHAKSFAIDGERVFIGSFNFDPRSALLNTEMGFLIDSPSIAADLSRRFDEQSATAAYRVVRAGDGRPEWIETDAAGAETRWRTDPRTTWSQRLAVTVIGWLPVQWLL